MSSNALVGINHDQDRDPVYRRNSEHRSNYFSGISEGLCWWSIIFTDTSICQDHMVSKKYAVMSKHGNYSQKKNLVRDLCRLYRCHLHLPALHRDVLLRFHPWQQKQNRLQDTLTWPLLVWVGLELGDNLAWRVNEKVIINVTKYLR